MKRDRSIYNIRRAELRKLFRRRLGDEPNLTQLDAEIERHAGCDWPSMASDELGRQIHLTLPERDYLDIRTIAPCDVSFLERQEYYREKKRKRDRQAARVRREKARKAASRPLSKAARRCKVLAAILRKDSEGSWWSITRLREALRDYAVFAGLSPATARQAIRRVLLQLLERRLIIHRRGVGSKGIDRGEFRWFR
jgi:hypothetical protein